jgi:di/tricarboxylate transporter
MMLVAMAIGSHSGADFKRASVIGMSPYTLSDAGEAVTDNRAVYAGVTLLMVVWWLFEVVPMGVTSFIPVLMFPLMGIVPGSTICQVYFSDQILILFGSCMLASAVEAYGLHRRLALGILRRTGNSPYRLVLGQRPPCTRPPPSRA